MKEYNEKTEKSIVNVNYIHIIGKINGKFAENAQNDSNHIRQRWKQREKAERKMFYRSLWRKKWKTAAWWRSGEE